MTRPRVGIVGAGQLGRMLALAGYPLGIDCTLLDTSADAPGAQVAGSVLGSLDDPRALAKLADVVDVVTLEIENVAVAALESLDGRIDVFPPPAAVAASQDRLAVGAEQVEAIPAAALLNDKLCLCHESLSSQELIHCSTKPRTKKEAPLGASFFAWQVAAVIR